MKLAIVGSRGYPYVYSGYETFVKEISERLVKKGILGNKGDIIVDDVIKPKRIIGVCVFNLK